MKANLYIELPADPGGTLRLARWREGEIETVQPTRAGAYSRTRAVAFAPALGVAKFRVSLAAKSESEARKIALYAIEDDLAQPVEDVHLTLGPKVRNEGARDVYVVDKVLMRAWTEALSALNLSHATIIPESSLNLADATIYDFGDRLLLSRDGMTVVADTAWPEEAIHELISACGLGGARRTAATALATLATLHSTSPGIPLNGAEVDASRRAAGKGFGRWLFAGVLALAAAGLWLASVWFETRSLQHATARNEITARAAYLFQFPGAPEPADLSAEVRRLSAGLAGAPPTSFRTLSAALYGALTDSPSIRLVTLTYADNEAALRARMQFANRAEEAAFRSRLEAKGLLVETELLGETPLAIDVNFIVRAAP